MESIQKKKNFRIHSLNNNKKALTLKSDEVYTQDNLRERMITNDENYSLAKLA